MDDTVGGVSGESGGSTLEAQAADADEPTVFSVLAERARGHPPAHLWGALLFGAADALAILIAYPAAWWIASAALILCAFGAWGLADEALVEDAFRHHGRGSRLLLRAIRGVAVAGGVLAALAATFGLMAAVLGGLIH
jgi:hypothetical protein